MFGSHKPYYANASDVPRSLQSLVSTIQTVVLTADVFQLFIKYVRCELDRLSGWLTTQLCEVRGMSAARVLRSS